MDKPFFGNRFPYGIARRSKVIIKRDSFWVEALCQREKNGKQIWNDLHPVALNIIGKPQEQTDIVFTLPSNVAISKNLKNWVKKAKIKKNISFYCGRHTFATQLLLNGANLKTVADCMGHTDTTHTIKYLNHTNKLKEEAINNLPSIDL